MIKRSEEGKKEWLIKCKAWSRGISFIVNIVMYRNALIALEISDDARHEKIQAREARAGEASQAA